MLQKIDYRQIPWIEEGKLYRGTFQSSFEVNVLKQLKKGFQYFGCLDSQEGEMSSTSRNWYDASLYPTKRDPDRNSPCLRSDMKHWPFSRYPLIMEIDARKYKDRLYAGTEWPSEAVIKGPILLEDITILFASNLNKLSKIRTATPTQLRVVSSSLQDCLREKNFSKEHNLFKHLEQDRAAVIGTLDSYAFGMRMYQQISEIEKLNEFLQVMREKFKSD